MHPGVVKTRIGNKRTAWWMGMIWYFISRIGINEDKGAATSVYLASSDQVEGHTGKYFYKSKEAKSSEASHDEVKSRKLWEVSSEMCGIKSFTNSF